MSPHDPSTSSSSSSSSSASSSSSPSAAPVPAPAASPRAEAQKAGLKRRAQELLGAARRGLVSRSETLETGEGGEEDDEITPKHAGTTAAKAGANAWAAGRGDFAIYTSQLSLSEPQQQAPGAEAGAGVAVEGSSRTGAETEAGAGRNRGTVRKPAAVRLRRVFTVAADDDAAGIAIVASSEASAASLVLAVLTKIAASGR